ncbi:MAG: hypothetical protein K5987_03195 [Lachnospiraceae bacterium]|nr:hypothetical protein [Lachnospiraceae bacterium]
MNISWKVASIGNVIVLLMAFVASLCGVFMDVREFIQEPQISDVIIVLFCLLQLVVSAFLLYFCILGVETRFTDMEIQTIRRGRVINSVKWDDYHAAALKRGIYGNVTVTLFPLYHTKIVIKKMTMAEMKREGVYQIDLDKLFVYSKEGSEVIRFIEQKYGVKWI